MERFGLLRLSWYSGRVLRQQDSYVALHQFLESLFADGHVRILQPTVDELVDEHAVATILREFEGEYRLDLPGEPPSLNLAPAMEAATWCHELCRGLAYRDLDLFDDLVGMVLPKQQTADTVYAVDLTMRFLPSIYSFAAKSDAPASLLESLRQSAMDWPLSSPGIAPLALDELGPIDVILNHCSLSVLYIDRVLQSGDSIRLQDKRVGRRAAAALGAFPELKPGLEITLP